MRYASLPVLALLLALAGLPRGAHAEDDGEMAGPPMDAPMLLGPARVLGSPGTPKALDRFLPGGARPKPLRWPLPDGPLVILGLPQQDDVAQRIADALQIDTDDLDGGYRIAAWRDGRRPIVVVMAADAAALAVARFEFDTSAPMEMAAPDMRSLDFKKPNQEAGVAVRMGTRLVKPRFAYRAWAPYRHDDKALVTASDVTLAAGAYANRLYFRPKDLRQRDAPTLIALARRHGIEPVMYAPMFDATIKPPSNNPMALFYPHYIEGLWKLARFGPNTARPPNQSGWPGIRHFAFEFSIDDDKTRPRHELPRGRLEEHVINQLGLTFVPRRAGQHTAEILIIPGAHADNLGRAPKDVPDVLAVAEGRANGPKLPAHAKNGMLVGWSGRTAQSTMLPSFEAGIRSEQAGLPLLLLDRWARPYTDDGARYMPSLPRGYNPVLELSIDGVVVMGYRGAAAQLEWLWAWEATEPPEKLLAEAAPPWPERRGSAWARAFAAKMAELDRENLGLLPWLKPLADELSEASKHPCWVLPRVKPLPRHFATPDHFKSRGAWDRASRTALQAGLPKGFELRAHVTDLGLEFEVTTKRGADTTVEPLLRIVIRDRTTDRRIFATWTAKGWTVEGTLGVGTRASDNIVLSRGERANETTHGLLLDRFALGGDLHIGRVLDVGIHWGPKAIWPPNGGMSTTAPWIIGPVGPHPLPPLGTAQPKAAPK